MIYFFTTQHAVIIRPITLITLLKIPGNNFHQKLINHLKFQVGECETTIMLCLYPLFTSTGNNEAAYAASSERQQLETHQGWQLVRYCDAH